MFLGARPVNLGPKDVIGSLQSAADKIRAPWCPDGTLVCRIAQTDWIFITDPRGQSMVLVGDFHWREYGCVCVCLI